MAGEERRRQEMERRDRVEETGRGDRRRSAVRREMERRVRGKMR